jgi:ABC-type multidrug transport system fused ATPase/permease subunit
VLGGVVVIVAETAVLVVLAVGLLALDPTVALATVAFFGLIGIFMYKALGSRARRLGIVQTETEVASITSIQNALRSYREMSVSGRRPLVVDSFQNLRWRAASVQADLQIVGQITKYVFEVSLVVGGGFLVWSQFARGESGAAIAVVAVFLAAASRTMPSLLRVQQAAVGIRSAMGGAIPVLAIHEELAKSITVTEAYSEVLGRVVKGVNEDHGTFEPSIELSKVTLQYPGTERPAVSNVSLRVRPGQTLAIVGVTGSGKSTLADLILGVLIPASGSVHIGGLPPWETAKRWPGSMAYVPQEVTIVEGTVRSNVVLGIPDKMVADEWVWKSLQRAQLANLFRAESQGLDTQVGEHGVRLSGGQKQRLGLARALLTNPKVLVMDEATSALDAETEHVISQALTDLEGEVTMVIIAHRLATVRRCDQVAYIEDGQVTALGTFEEVRALVPRFDRQAELLGL